MSGMPEFRVLRRGQHSPDADPGAGTQRAFRSLAACFLTARAWRPREQGRQIALRPAAIHLGMALVLSAGGCTRSPADGEGSIGFGRNSEFAGPALRVFVTLEDGRQVTVNTTDDAIESRSAATPIPGLQSREWTFVKDVADGTSVVHALVSWNGEDPELPTEGAATYVGQAGGLYAYVAGIDWGDDKGALVSDEYEGVITMTADFATNTISGCIGCEGNLVTRRAHLGIFLGEEFRDIRSIAADYELHFGDTLFNPEGTFQDPDVTVRHPARAVTHTEGHWGGLLSNVPDQDGNPRLVAGFSSAEFEDSDGSVGEFIGTFVALSNPFRESG